MSSSQGGVFDFPADRVRMEEPSPQKVCTASRKRGKDVSDTTFSLTNVQDALDAAADAVATAPPEQWAGWVCYFLEALEALADIKEYRAVLEDVREDVTIRLERGRW